jgi:AraC-like DNA-binding protein
MTTQTKTFFRYFPVSPRDLSWESHVTTAGESHIAPHSPYPPGGHPEGYAFDLAHGRTMDNFAVIYISEGRGWFESRPTGRQRIESGTVMLVFPGVWHRYAPNPANGWTEHWVGFDGQFPRRLRQNGFFTERQPIFKITREDILLDAFRNIIDAIQANQPALQQVLAGATGYILSLLYSVQQSGTDRQTNVATAIREAIHLMNDRIEAELDLKVLAQELKVSYTWFRRSFQQHTGLSPHQYRLDLKIAKARNLLASTTMTVQQAALHSGFETEQYFCRLFKKKTGLTPGQWRRQAQNQPRESKG